MFKTKLHILISASVKKMIKFIFQTPVVNSYMDVSFEFVNSKKKLSAVSFPIIPKALKFVQDKEITVEGLFEEKGFMFPGLTFPFGWVTGPCSSQIEKTHHYT